MSRMAELADNRYGKSRVRLLRLLRSAEASRIDDWTIEVMLEGDFAATYMNGDNSAVLPTDTMKNTVYALARDSKAVTIERFAQEITAHLLGHTPSITAAEVHIASALWKRLALDGQPAPHAFMHGSEEQGTVRVRQICGGPPQTTAGLDNMVILKTAQSAFSGFLRDDLTTLPDTDDRLMGTAVSASWAYLRQPADYDHARTRLRESMLTVFATHASASVQHTLFAMGEAALAVTPEIDAIDITMPNRHYLLADLNRLGRDNPNMIFVPTQEPHGLIQARVRRGSRP